AEVAGAPAFAGEADEVAGLFEQVRIGFEAGGEEAVVRDGFAELPGVAASEDAGPARAAFRIGRKGVFEEDTFAGDAVEVGRFDPGAAVSAGVGAAVPVVEDDEEDVGALCLLWLFGLLGGRGCEGGHGCCGSEGEGEKAGEHGGEGKGGEGGSLDM